jgi:outer membrane protein W
MKMNMKRIAILTAAAALTFSPAAMAQKWEFGGGLGGSFTPANTVTNGSASADAGAETNIAGALWLTNSVNNHWGGEMRLGYSRGDLTLTSGNTQAKFGSEAYTLHYDFQFHFAPVGARIRPYVAAGGGVKYYRGTGTQVLVQPLSQFALLTKANQLKPLLSLGAGVKVKLTNHLGLRLEVHDYLTAMPEDLITPYVGSKLSGWRQEIVPMVGISYLF